ncbi:hypothetical protein TUM19329_29840 [Legionella antarctica]|uniref:Uncharacterized protein n=1 Tax=Legionella antarctica TaxID=2708020 RepID=A0A6F8T8S2_9GAMM|nr:hypothetical protein [Legionella antarctica]BCA96623.1 hypothetical protein TUM19329_29840 [Legionella antarctica]
MTHDTTESKKNSSNPLAGRAHQTQSFAQLKLEEYKQFSYKKRRRSDYKRNYSFALALPYPTDQLAKNQNNQSELLNMSAKYVIEHANRRVDLFFYTLIAYYNTGFLPTFGHTDLQHGRGRNTKGFTNITEACHSSFTPSLLDKTIYQNTMGKEKNKSLLSGTHLMDSLNSTVELPPFINALDDILELACRQKCLEILADVSIGKINPVEGLTFFLKMMQDVLTNLKQQAEHKNSSLLQHSLIRKKQVNPKLLDLVIRGTLSTTYSDQTKSAAGDYIQLLLRMTPEEKALCGNSEKSKEKLYMEKMTEMQREILQTKSSSNIARAF